MVLPKQDIQEIKLSMVEDILTKEQYQFICSRLIDTIKQLEDKSNDYRDILRYISKGTMSEYSTVENMSNDFKSISTDMLEKYRELN